MGLPIMTTIDGKLPSCVWPGGYPLYYEDKAGGIMCADCADESLKCEFGGAAEHYGVHWEGPPLACDDCGDKIDSAYGEPDEEGS
jgi:hypothetical protein